MTRAREGRVKFEGVAGHLPLEGVAAHAVAAWGRHSPLKRLLLKSKRNTQRRLDHPILSELEIESLADHGFSTLLADASERSAFNRLIPFL